MNDELRVPYELILAEELARLLRAYGETSLVYLTAEFAPFSDQFKPDVVFTPSIGPKTGITHFVELRFARSRALSFSPSRSLREHLAFVKESFEGEDLCYAFATDEHISPAIKEELSLHGIESFSEYDDPALLATSIARWAKTPVPPDTI